jgi:ATP-dependent exoDNAse (exonuclease V) beta subunit
VLDEAIDTMFSNLEKSENKELLGWLIRFSEESIENGKGWEVRKNIHSLAREIFKENYKTLVSKSDREGMDRDLLSEYKRELSAIIAAFENCSRQLGEKGVNILHRYGLNPEDFSYGKNSGLGSFLKWANGNTDAPSNRFLGLCDNLEVWAAKKASPDIKAKIEEVYSELNACIQEVIEHYSDTCRYRSAVEINRYYFTLGILSDIDSKVREYCTENNLMLISDTTELLSKIIEGTDTPFVYEKIGSRIDHYMIDEFQDTSSLQWANFLPLVKNSLASGNMNLIVGDVKQSIYRWRNSDWKLLNEQLAIDFRHEGVSHDSLDVNWRSSKNVIEFNNTVFKYGAALLQDSYNNSLPDVVNDKLEPFSHKILDAYNGLEQSVPAKNAADEGHVKVSFIDTEEEDSWKEIVLAQIPTLIEQLQHKKYSLKDIAILVRTKAEGYEVATRLLQYASERPDSNYKYDIISNEALYITNSDNVKAAIALLRHIKNPLDNNLKAMAVYEYYKQSYPQDIASSVRLHLNSSADFNEEEKGQIHRISSLPLYEMMEEIFGFFSQYGSRKEDIYIQAFLDKVLDFTINHSSDTDAFLRWWDENGTKETVFTPDTQDAIRIMTIHKSKGLGFGVVLLPFCNWPIDDSKEKILWCQTTEQPFNKISPVPVRYSKNLANTIFNYDYFSEKIHTYIDNLNVLYVAFTRAKKELYAFAPKPKKENELKNISSLLWNCVQANPQKEGLLNTGDSFDVEDALFEVGKDYQPVHKKEVQLVGETHTERLVSIPFDNRLKLRMNNRYFFAKDGQREFGNLMHEIVSHIDTVADLPLVLKAYVESGELAVSESDRIEKEIDEFLNLENVKKWYSGTHRVLNEVEILLPNGNFVRPDRVMLDANQAIVIDYKFGEKEEKKYEKQVKRYIDHIREIGYANVTGYVCYVKLRKVVEIAS